MSKITGRGLFVLYDPDLPQEVQTETFTCAHCNSVRPLDKAGPVCKKCMMFVCPTRECANTCSPFKARLY